MAPEREAPMPRAYSQQVVVSAFVTWLKLTRKLCLSWPAPRLRIFGGDGRGAHCQWCTQQHQGQGHGLTLAPKIETSLAQGIWTWEKVAANALTASTHRIWNAYARIWIMACARAHVLVCATGRRRHLHWLALVCLTRPVAQQRSRSTSESISSQSRQFFNRRRWARFFACAGLSMHWGKPRGEIHLDQARTDKHTHT